MQINANVCIRFCANKLSEQPQFLLFGSKSINKTAKYEEN